MPILRWIRQAAQSVDEAIDSLENRDDVVRAVIADSDRAEALVRAELEHIRAQVESTKLALGQTARDAESWRSKAKAVARTDREAAITFLHRKKRCETRALELSTWLRDCAQREQALVHQAEQIRHRTRALEQQHKLLRSRERTAQTYDELTRRSGQTKKTEALLGRWQSRLEKQELRSFGSSVIETEVGEELAISSFEEEELDRELALLLAETEEKAV